MSRSSALDSQPLLSLLRLVSPALPVGTYSYSQGFEYAVDSGAVASRSDVRSWLQGVMHHGMAHLEIPLLRNCYGALQQDCEERLNYWNEESLAARESAELRLEDIQMGKALWRLLDSLSEPLPPVNTPSWVTAYSVAAFRWGIPLQSAAEGFVWSWLENQLMVAAKLVPLGQTDVQRLMSELLSAIPDAVKTGLQVADEDIGMGLPGLVIGSMRHETQYSRLFRS